MPELPEIETVRRGLAPHLSGRGFVAAVVREARLRWPVPADLDARIRNRRILDLRRRGKYLLLKLDDGWLICHLGMSGSLRLMPSDTPLRKHDHIDLQLDDGQVLRYHDPRRFGALLWSADPAIHPLIAALGVEPLSDDFDGPHLHALCRGRTSAIKQLIMDSHLLVGVGNIYANEVLFHAGIDPRTPAGSLSRPRCARLAAAIKEILLLAIAAGGSTLRDFVDGHGNPGWFQQTYRVYGRAGQPCAVCGGTIRTQRLGARATCYCPRCQHR
ncbi:MAG: bifunctional DNA-formamidopyrimidine glycosylase/DNA-(apurinic or apyrimidinic site) lyase [Pseudomonadota bacterium]|nr:bifunctional DNA-formamidopyrimidine glycosylase/DNA-(apurinic or apyrimidinic site) lyase [Pseudomonadota bacterium]